ncbi:hypothetical protein [Shewanella oncorhynchi]|uniref:McrB family protein n=1 Tax=Shewanella oncorhynchi TaxID=2726434 RepID=UPI003D7AEB69
MDNKNKPNAQSIADNALVNQTDKTRNVTEASSLNQQELKKLEYSLTQKETLLAEMELEQNDKHLHLVEMELQAKNGFPKLFEEKFAVFKKQLEEREAKCLVELESLEGEKEKLRQREVAVQKAEIQRDNGYADDRAKLYDELFNLRKEQEKDLESKRANALTAIEKELSEERRFRIANLEKEIADRLRAYETAIQQDKDELEQKRKALLKDQAELDELKDELEYQKQRLKSSKDRLEERESNLNLEVDAKVVERKQSFESEKSALNDEIARLRESIKTSSALISNFEELKHKLGDEDPAAVLLKLKTYEEEIKKLREDLATRPTQEMQEAFDRLTSEKSELQLACERLSEENEILRSSARTQSDLEMQVAELSDKNKSLQRRFESVDADNNRLMEELKRLQSAYVRESDFEKRKINIEKPYIEKVIPRNEKLKVEAGQFLELQAKKKLKVEFPKDDEQKYSELDHKIGTYEQEWLGRISSSSLDYGLKFPRRILHAFHTALKTSEWSPVTVLAGVSGTGKSELPRLYSHFGGINFLSLSVQPNWDSQESMLGFFNSIDNEFDAREVLRFLVQSQRKQTSNNPYGLEDTMSLILMDEMNLAHVELYFAEFLSKLELRRGLKGDTVPSLPVKLGVGSDFIYPLSLGRNVLWAGTMNQDETTKSLSDKVLDRGIVINFPRPTTLERRRQLKLLGEQAPLLSRKLWESWWCRESKFTDDQILPFKGFVEDMNNSLSKVGRALGHRVWQSIEYYMANYPDVLEAQRNHDDVGLALAMKIAFEDQLVQKVMPKLRGIETRGKSKSDCLDKIRTKLVNDDYDIVEDFDLACEFGYGQFIWNSANYLKDDEAVNGQENAEY